LEFGSFTIWLPPGDWADPVAIVLGVATLALPLFTSFARVAERDRHSLYSQRTDLGFVIISVALASAILSPLLGLMALFGRSGLQVARIGRASLFLPHFFLSEAILFTAIAVALSASYRSGLTTKCICDNYTCDQRLYLRFRRIDCFSTGRVMCGKCYRNLCATCLSNLACNQQALEAPVSFSEDHRYNRCQRIGSPR
jgi:hypothetical protein